MRDTMRRLFSRNLPKFVAASVLFMWLACCAAGQSDPSKSTSLASVQTSANPLVRLGPGDLVEISVYGVPELTTKARIGSNGDVYLPLINYVHLGGLTTEQAQSV